MSDLSALAGRILLGLLFVLDALQKLGDPVPAMDLLVARGLPPILIWPALLFSGAAGIVFFAGYRTRAFALIAAAFSAITSYVYFLPDDPVQMSIFVRNLSIAGGFLVLAAQGPGKYSWDRA